MANNQSLPEGKRRSADITITVTPAEKLRLANLAKKSGMPLSTWARRILIDWRHAIKR